MNYEIASDEIILFEGHAGYKEDKKGSVSTRFTLTSKKMIFEKEIGFFKTRYELYKEIKLSDIKIYNGEVQCKQQSDSVFIQTTNENISLFIGSILDARKVCSSIINTVTGTTIAERGSNKVKKAIDLVDDTLGIDSKGIVGGILQNGIKGTLINGFRNKKKQDK